MERMGSNNLRQGINTPPFTLAGTAPPSRTTGTSGGWPRRWTLATQNPADDAFVFTDAIVSDVRTVGDYAHDIAGYVTHEVGHLLGFEHEHEVRGDHPSLLDPVAYKPYTHIETALDVRRDVLEDGQVTIEGGEYPVHPRIVEAIRQYPDYFYGGAADDAFPDIVMAQAIIHPDAAGIWVGHALDKAWEAQAPGSPWSPAEQLQILAWAYGYTFHVAGDTWAHNLVNEFADGPAPDFVNHANPDSDLARLNIIRHLIVEGYHNDASPGFDGIKDENDEVQRNRLPDGDVSDLTSPPRSMNAPHAFIYEVWTRDLPDLPGHKENVLFHITTATDVAARIAELDGGTVSPDLRAAFFASSLTAPIVLTDNPTVTTLDAGDVWKITSDYRDYLVRREVVAGGSSILTAFENVQPRGQIIDFFLTLRDNLARLREALPDPSAPLNEPFDAEIDRILEAGERLKRGQDINFDDIYEDIKGLVDTVINAFSSVFDDVAAGNTPSNAALTGLAQAMGQQGGLADPLEATAAYLDYWIGSIDIGLQNWSRFGLATSRALFFDPQSTRDIQNSEGVSEGPDVVDPGFPDARADVENDVGVIDRVIDELEDPNDDGATDDVVHQQVPAPDAGHAAPVRRFAGRRRPAS